MANDLDEGMALLTRLIARRGRSRLFLSALLLVCGLALVAYWNMPVRDNAFVERELMIHRAIGAIGAIMAVSSGIRLYRAVNEAFSPTEHAIYREIANGRLKMMVRDTGSVSSLNFDFEDKFETLEGTREECATLLSYLTRRFPHVPVKEIAVIIRRV